MQRNKKKDSHMQRNKKNPFLILIELKTIKLSECVHIVSINGVSIHSNLLD
jgi:hypothetical protein